MSIEQRLAGKVALVTGGSRGIGEAIARRLAADGANVAFTYRSGKDEAQVIAADLSALGRRALVIEADPADPEAPASVVAATVGGLGRLDIVVDNAGVTSFSRLDQVSAETFDHLVAVDARAPFLLLAAAAGSLADGGRVITISSALTSTALAGPSLSMAAKAFVDQLTKVAAVELAPRKITVNAVAPGATATGRLSNPSPEQGDPWGAAFSLGRIGEPDDTAALVAFLASGEAGFVTGQVITNNGGQLGPVGRAA
jgi:3-oxoacyl-[acyl-carrier protein] reductase